YAVEKTIEGRAHEVKEYSIGVDVFDRGKSFDPRLDNIVRAEARKLRLRLNKYYAGEGRADLIRIDLPSRGYVPFFREADESLVAENGHTAPATAKPETANIDEEMRPQEATLPEAQALQEIGPSVQLDNVSAVAHRSRRRLPYARTASIFAALVATMAVTVYVVREGWS